MSVSDDEYVFGQGSVFQILDDMAALREERERRKNDDIYGNVIYDEESYSSPEEHSENCVEDAEIIPTDDVGAKSAYSEESYSSPEEHLRNCAENGDITASDDYGAKAAYEEKSYSADNKSGMTEERKRYLREKYGKNSKLQNIKKQRNINKAKNTAAHQNQPQTTSKDFKPMDISLPTKGGKVNKNEVVIYIIMLIAAVCFPVPAFVAGCAWTKLSPSPKSIFLTAAAVVYMLLKFALVL